MISEFRHVAVVSVDEAAVAQASGPQLPQWSRGLERFQRLLDRGARQPLAGVGRESLDDLEVAPDRLMDPDQLREDRLAALGFGVTRHEPWRHVRAPVGRRPR